MRRSTGLLGMSCLCRRTPDSRLSWRSGQGACPPSLFLHLQSLDHVQFRGALHKGTCLYMAVGPCFAPLCTREGSFFLFGRFVIGCLGFSGVCSRGTNSCFLFPLNACSVFSHSIRRFWIATSFQVAMAAFVLLLEHERAAISIAHGTLTALKHSPQKQKSKFQWQTKNPTRLRRPRVLLCGVLIRSCPRKCRRAARPSGLLGRCWC